MLDWLSRKLRNWWTLVTTRQIEPARGLEHRRDRLQRALESELSTNASFTLRGTALAVGSALAILLLAQFSATWLDDNLWEFSGRFDDIQEACLFISIGALAACILLAWFVVWPRRRSSEEKLDRVTYINEGRNAEEARLVLRMLESQRAMNERKRICLRIASIPIAVAVVTAMAQAAIFAIDATPVDRGACISSDGDAERPAEFVFPVGTDPQALAESYAPRVYVHPTEPWGPLPPQRFIDASKLVWNSSRGDEELTSRGDIDAARLGAECEQSPGGCYSHSGCSADQVTRPTESAAIRAPGLNERRGFAIDPDRSVKRPPPPAGNPEADTYYEFRGDPASGVRVTYWFFYGYSQPKLLDNARIPLASHEGDWESIDVKVARDPSVPGGYTPKKVIFYAHGLDPPILDWSEITVVLPDGTQTQSPKPRPAHPVVFSARLSHASYPNAGRHPCGDLCEDLTGKGLIIWDTWLRGVRRVTEQDWYGFGGAWGAGGGLKGQIGPLGPSPWKQASDPDPDNVVIEPGSTDSGSAPAPPG
ncbi:MAG: hypothetical protein ACXWFN_08095 [Solirubrobacterales bacterium]